MFNKMLLINISETSIEKDYWDEIDMLCKKKVFLPQAQIYKENHEIHEKSSLRAERSNPVL